MMTIKETGCFNIRVKDQDGKLIVSLVSSSGSELTHGQIKCFVMQSVEYFRRCFSNATVSYDFGTSEAGSVSPDPPTETV